MRSSVFVYRNECLPQKQPCFPASAPVNSKMAGTDMTSYQYSSQKKSKRPHPGALILSQTPEGGEGKRGQMPHICPGSPPLGLNIDRCITDKTLLVPSCSQKRRTVPKKVFPPSKHPLLVSFAPFRELKAAAHLLTRTSDQAKKSRNLPFGGHVCLRDFCRAQRTRVWIPESELTNQTKVSFVG